ncbi:shikimate dehydrogenase [Tissierella sp.]|uniref:shikimate dehydrogenase n=1 Tax=Tissierella sp. TaxID=41274 RepID=UPI002858F681|nr:shikimate dehydrogenase [Tissierella sp.]MDR7856012.1 shikimate dehydrogenase [Tissierella sp.]
MNITYETNLYCLIGNPIEKSLSPIIHNSIFEIFDRNCVYLSFNINGEDLENTINAFRAMKVKGFNVTIPHKKNIIKYLDDITTEAKIMGAVNTVKNENGKFVGYNTDGEGFIQTFSNNNIDLKDKNILLLGSGGAAFSIGVTLAMQDINSIYIGNRNIESCILLKEKINSINNKIITNVDNLQLENIDKKSIDIIINSTPIGMYPMEDMSPIELNGYSKETIVYDIVYKPLETKLLYESKLKGFKVFSGISMLLNQAILSQKIWFDLKEINFKIIEKLAGNLSSYVE